MRFFVMAVVVGVLATLPASAQRERVDDAVPSSAGISSPVLLKQVAPIYPAKARSLNVRGSVTLDLTVRTTGQPRAPLTAERSADLVFEILS